MKAIDNIITRFEDYVTVLCFSLMSIVTLVAVFFRYVLSDPIVWAEEVARYLMIWGIFIGISIVTRKKAQLGIDIFVTMAPENIRKALAFISHLLLIVTYALVLYLSIRFVVDSAELGNLTPTLRIKFFYVYLAMPIGFFLSLYRALQNFVNEYIRKIKPDEDREEVYL